MSCYGTASDLRSRFVPRRILVIQGHPDPESFNHALHRAYQQGATHRGGEVREIRVGDLDFNPNLQFGYRARTTLEPCLVKAQEDILWSQHIVLFYPVWWGSVPAVLKGFFDRVFLPGFAFKKREGSLLWNRLLLGRSARIVSTLDQPTWFYWLVNGAPSDKAVKRMTLQFCGIGPVKITNIGPLRLSTPQFREKWLRRIGALGAREAEAP